MASVEQYPFEQGSKAAGILMDLLQKDDLNDRPDAPETFQNIVINGQLVIHKKR